MSQTNPEPHLLKCPLCEGRGELPEQDLFDRLHEKDLCRKMESYLANFVSAEVRTTSPEGSGPQLVEKPDFRKDVETWNCTHFLWRRSPKE